jgi:hypothetical protein
VNDKPSSVLLQSICSNWSHSLTDLTIATLGENAWHHAGAGPLDDQIEALTSLRVLERLTLSSLYITPKEEDFMKLLAHPNLPFTLKDISWVWKEQVGRQRTEIHNNIRQSCALHGIMCHDIDYRRYIQ